MYLSQVGIPSQKDSRVYNELGKQELETPLVPWGMSLHVPWFALDFNKEGEVMGFLLVSLLVLEVFPNSSMEKLVGKIPDRTKIR